MSPASEARWRGRRWKRERRRWLRVRGPGCNGARELGRGCVREPGRGAGVRWAEQGKGSGSGWAVLGEREWVAR